MNHGSAMNSGARLIICLLLLSIQPRTGSSQAVEGLVNIRFQLDARVFATMAALNAGGFDLDAESLASNPARKLVRERLASLDPDLRERLKEFCTSQEIDLDPYRQQSRYISLAMALTHPPAIALAVKPENVPAEAQALIGFERLVQELWEKGDLANLWQEVRAHYLRAAEEHRPVIRNILIGTLRYMRTEARIALDRQVMFIPDLLNAFGVVNARNIGDDYYLVVGPSRAPARSARAVRHEYLHFMIDPLVRKYMGYLPRPDPFMEIARARSRLLPRYRDDFALLLAESLIHALELRIETPSDDDRMLEVASEYEEGLVLEPYFYEALVRFEGGRGSLQEYFLAMIENISLDKEKGRAVLLARQVEEIGARRVRMRAEAEASALARSEERRLLVEANRHLLERRFEDATALLEKVLDRSPNNPHALYGLAQIAGQGQDLDRALELYEKAATHAGEETWIAGWSHVRRGNIFQFREDLDRARAEWEKARSLKGDLRGAAEAAVRALQSARP